MPEVWNHHDRDERRGKRTGFTRLTSENPATFGVRKLQTAETLRRNRDLDFRTDHVRARPSCCPWLPRVRFALSKIYARLFLLLACVLPVAPNAPLPPCSDA